MKHIEIRFGSNIETRATDDKSFEDMFQSVSPMFCLSQRIWKPQMDIFETRHEIRIQAEIAGVEKEDIVIEVSPKAVKITGTRKCRQLEPTATYRLAEIQFGRFERVLYLPTIIDVEKTSAEFSNGFLEISLGKLHTDDKRNITIDFC